MSSGAVTGVDRRAGVERDVADLIYRGILLMDRNDFLGWLDLCTPDFHYTISTYSPEIRKDMTWLDHDREGMVNLIRLLPKHNSDQTPLTRHATVYSVDCDEAKREAQAVTSVAIFATALDGGASDLYAIARYHDTIDLAGDAPRLKHRVVRLDTRSLGIGKHWPL